VVGRVWSFRDITEHRRAETALLESEEKFHALFAQSPLAIVLTTFPEGRVADANAAAELLLGRKLDEVRGKTSLELNVWVDPADREHYLEALQRESVLRNYEVRMRGKDGVEITVLYNGRVIYFGSQAYALNSLLDISARKQAEAELRRAKQMIEDIVESVDGIVWESDAQTFAFTFVSPQAERILGYPLSRWIEEPTFWSDHIHPDDRERAVNFCSQSTKEMRDHEFEYRMLAADGRVIQLRDIVTVVVEQNQAVRLRGLMLDITKQKMLEEHLRQTQKMEAIGQLSGGVAHDLNNLLTVIKGHTGLLRAKDQVTPQMVEPIHQIEKAADRAANLTRHLLAFSRQQVMQPVGLNLNGMVHSLTKMLRRLLSESIEMVVECAPQPLLIRADEGMVEQVLLNLVVNARDALPGTGSLRITTGQVDFDEPAARSKFQRLPGAFVCLAVSDTGSGIPPEIMPRIFEPFFTTKEIGKGTGLGLASAYGIMQQHGGWIEAESEVGRGTTLRVYFPRLATAVQEKSVAPGNPVLRGGHEGILLVEDESAVRVVAEAALTGLGYRVFSASSGQEALQVWETQRHEIELLLTDLVMPGITGRDLALRLRESTPRLPVIYMSGYNREMAGGNFALSEGSNFLPKPFDLTSLASLVRISLDRGASNPPFAQRSV
jgi:PAS domain S-box-containing protein